MSKNKAIKELNETLQFSTTGILNCLLQEQKQMNQSLEKLVAILSDAIYGTGLSRVDPAHDTYGLMDATDCYVDDWATKIENEISTETEGETEDEELREPSQEGTEQAVQDNGTDGLAQS